MPHNHWTTKLTSISCQQSYGWIDRVYLSVNGIAIRPAGSEGVWPFVASLTTPVDIPILQGFAGSRAVVTLWEGDTQLGGCNIEYVEPQMRFVPHENGRLEEASSATMNGLTIMDQVVSCLFRCHYELHFHTEERAL